MKTKNPNFSETFQKPKTGNLGVCVVLGIFNSDPLHETAKELFLSDVKPEPGFSVFWPQKPTRLTRFCKKPKNTKHDMDFMDDDPKEDEDEIVSLDDLGEEK